MKKTASQFRVFRVFSQGVRVLYSGKEPFFNNEKTRKNKMKNTSKLIIDTLLTGSALRTPEIQNKLAAAGHKMELSNIASLLRVLSDKDKSNLGHFLNRKRTSKGYVYSIVEEALKLTPEQIYGLTRKIGTNSFSLNQAIEKIPALKQYTQPSKKHASANPRASGENNMLIEGLKEVILQGGVNFNITCSVQIELFDNLED